MKRLTWTTPDGKLHDRLTQRPALSLALMFAETYGVPVYVRDADRPDQKPDVVRPRGSRP